jgi:hypothetical protein
MYVTIPCITVDSKPNERLYQNDPLQLLYTTGFKRNELREDIVVGTDSRVIRCGGGGGNGVVFVEERSGVAAASTLVANAVNTSNRRHSSLFSLHFDLRGEEKEGVE